MDILASERERQRLEALYARMSDGELQNLAQDAGSLTEIAIQALSQEAQRRGLDIAMAESQIAQDVVEQRELTVIRQFRDMPEALLAKKMPKQPSRFWNSPFLRALRSRDQKPTSSLIAPAAARLTSATRAT